ncbi:unnamed protein product [Nezara viridula]|uniref:Uncharacterized protein n=1 Tax=Nezara viridula TaxID=85310 RepID=A0A9P0MUX9_NEZVI|nr:unnamed protein product [Nezara viridula]
MSIISRGSRRDEHKRKIVVIRPVHTSELGKTINSVRPSERERVHRERPLVWVSRNYPKKNKELPRGVDIKDVARLAENIVLESLGIIHHHVHG